MDFNRLGVEAFLVIASYFLTSKFLKTEQSEIAVGEVFLHRIKRLYPAYLTIVLLFTVVLFAHTRRVNPESLWYILSLQNFRVLFEHATYDLDGFLGHFWYIGLDVWLFLLWVVIMRMVPRKYLKVAFVISVISGIAWRTSFILMGKYAASYMIPIGQLDCWALGGLLALNIKEKGKSNVVMLLEITLGILGIVGLTIYNAFLSGCSMGESYQLWHSSGGYVHNILTGNIHFVIALLSVGILRFCIDTTRHHPILSSAPLVALGGMTYELYCFHYPIKVFVKHLIQNDYLMVIAALIATCIVTLLWSRYAMPVFKKIIK